MDKNTSLVAIISGGSGLVGSAIAHKLAEDGYAVALLCHKAVGKAETIIRNLPGKNHAAFACDITKEEETRTILEDIARVGVIKVCVHSAASPLERKRVLDLSLESFRMEFDVNVFGGFNLFQTAVPYMDKEGGILMGITTAALESSHAVGKMGGYIPAKSALRGLLAVLAKELSLSNIRVFAVAPGFIPGGINADLPEHVFKFIREKNISKLESPEDVAGAVSFLCSDKASSLSGLSLLVSSGETSIL